MPAEHLLGIKIQENVYYFLFLYKYGVQCLPIQIYNYLALVLHDSVVSYLNAFVVT